MRNAILILLTILPLVGQAQTKRVFQTLAEMDATRPSKDEPVSEVMGIAQPGDWGNEPRLFYYDPTSVAPTSHIVRAIGTNSVGRRIHKWNGDVQTFGAKGDGVQDDSDRLNEAFAHVGLSADRRIIIPKTGAFYKISKQLVFTNSNATIDWHGKIRCADGVNYHILMFGTNPTFDVEGRPQTIHSNLVINGYGVGEFDGNSHNAAEYFPVSTAAVYGGHGFNFVGYDNVQINGMVVRDVPNWAINFQRCNRFKALDNTVLTGTGNNSTNWNGKNQDGIHMVDSWDGVVSGNWVRSSDDNYAITVSGGNSRNIVISDNIGEHNMLESTSFQAGGQYFALGMNVRVTTDVAVTKHIRNVLVANNMFYGGNGGFTLHNLGTQSNQVQDIQIIGNTFHSKTNLGGNGYLGTQWGFLSRVNGITVRGNKFLAGARTIFIQDGSNIDISDNEFVGDSPNSNITSAITVSGETATLTDNRNFTFNRNRFNGTYRSGIRVSGLKTSNDRRFYDIQANDNEFLNGPQDAGRFAIQITGFGGRIQAEGNVFQNWTGGGIMVLYPDSSVSIARNTWMDCTDATLPMVQVLTTNGMLIPYVSVRDNSVFRHGNGFDIRNVEVLDIEGNSVVSAQQQQPFASFFSLLWTGDGSGTNPVTTGMRGRFQNNFISRTNTGGNAVQTVYSSMPTYVGSPFYVRGNRVVGISTPYNTANPTLFPNYEMLDQRPMFGSIVPSFGSYFQYGDFTLTNGGAGMTVDRTIFVEGPLTTAATAFNAITRLGGSGTNAALTRAGIFVSSHDRTNHVTEVRALEAQARLTLSGSASSARAIYGQIVAQTNGFIDTGYAIVGSTPSLSGGGTMRAGGGLLINEQAVAGVTNGIGIRQEGANDLNYFAGRIHLGNSTAFPFLTGGTGVPAMSAPNGSLFLRYDSTTDPLYVRSNGVWVVK